jgi:hypothetical protein
LAITNASVRRRFDISYSTSDAPSINEYLDGMDEQSGKELDKSGKKARNLLISEFPLVGVITYSKAGLSITRCRRVDEIPGISVERLKYIRLPYAQAFASIFASTRCNKAPPPDLLWVVLSKPFSLTPYGKRLALLPGTG